MLTSTWPEDPVTSLAASCSCSCVALVTAVGLVAPFHRAIDEPSNPVPVQVKATAAVPPARRRAGVQPVSVGTGCEIGTRDPRALKTFSRGTVCPPPKKMRSSVIGTPVDRRDARIVVTLALGAAPWRIAHAPATWGAAIEVPLNSVKPPPGTDDRMASPGAKSDMNDETFEKYETASLLSTAPTLIALETQDGEAIALPSLPLPDAITLATPIARRLSMAGL